MKTTSKYVNINAIINVIGCVYKAPYLLDREDKYNITEEDFPDVFHRIVFGAIYKLHQLGAETISILNIEDFLKGRPKSEAIFNQNKGAEWLAKAESFAAISSFDYYYNKLKKMTLLRAYDDIGIDVSDIYDPDNILDAKKLQAQEELLDNSSLVELADIVDAKISRIRSEYADGTFGQSFQAGENIYDLIEELKTTPAYGIPLWGGGIMNAVTRGARLGKFFLRSAASGYGKSRLMAADAAYIACGEYYVNDLGWVGSKQKNPTVFISTELTIDEVQTMFLAFLSNVNEGHILDGRYEEGEEERVLYAAEILQKSPLYVEELMDFSLQDVENIITKNTKERNVSYIFMDYIHSSLKILEEISQKTKGMPLREDNVLFMLSNRMKNICNAQGVFIMSATQLNGGKK